MPFLKVVNMTYTQVIKQYHMRIRSAMYNVINASLFGGMDVYQ